MFQKPLHEFRALYPMDIRGPVVDIGGCHELSTLGHTGDKHRVQVSSGGVNRCGIAGRAGAQNQDFGVEGLGHEMGLTFERTDVNEGGELGGVTR
jgi:hypothetical protein